MKTAHTPTPYTLRAWGKTISIESASRDRQIAVVNPYDDHDNGIPDAQTRANAEFIVRAVNNHDTLITALENAAAKLTGMKDNYRVNQANKIIADALAHNSNRLRA